MTNLDKLKYAIENMADGFLIVSDVNRLYVTDFDYSDGYALVTKNKSYLITDFRYIEAAEKTASQELEKVMIKGLSDGTVNRLLKENNVSTLLYEDGRITCRQLDSLKRLFDGVEFVPAGNMIEELRESKSDTELQRICKAQEIAETSLNTLISQLDKNMTEQELAAYLEYLMKKNGADGISFSTIAVSGSASSLPHGVPRKVRLEEGFLTIDFGAIYMGCHSDMTRTFCIGKATDEMKRVYKTVLKAQTSAIEAIMQGERRCLEIDRIARDIIYKAGYEGCFGHGLGHGVGLEIHESPRLSPSVEKDAVLKPGDVVTVEPGIYLANKFGVRIEDMIYIGENNAVNLTKMPKKLIEL